MINRLIISQILLLYPDKKLSKEGLMFDKNVRSFNVRKRNLKNDTPHLLLDISSVLLCNKEYKWMNTLL